MSAAYLVRGDARRLPLASASVQCVVTSPPYMGLRSYGGQTSVWGGDPECEHVIRADPKTGQPMTGGTGPASVKQVSNHGSQFGNVKPIITGGSCVRCGAMRCELGSEPDPQSFVVHLVEVCREVWRVMRDDAVFFLNMGSSYAGSGKGPTGHNGIGDQKQRQGFTGNGGMHRKALEAGAIGNAWVPAPPGIRQKSDMLIPQRLAIALSDDGWIVRQVLIWAKNNPMPESVRDRWTTAHEYVLMLVKQPRYYFDQAGIQENVGQPTRRAATFRNGGVYTNHRADDNSNPDRSKDSHGDGPESLTGRNGRSVWEISTDPYKGAHYAVFPRDLVKRCVSAATSEYGACAGQVKKLRVRTDLTSEQRERVQRWLDRRKPA